MSETTQDTHTRRFKLSEPVRRYMPFIIFGLLLFLLFLSIQITGSSPVITSIEPKISQPGQVLLITGRHFGNVHGRVSISGIVPVSSAYLEWSPSRIAVRIPEDAGSGLVYVVNSKGRSEGVLFTNKNDIPVVAGGMEEAEFPFIESIEPERGSVGDILTISGRNFGPNRGSGLVYFTWSTSPDAEPLGTGGGIMSHYIPATTMDYDYEAWADREIRVRIPMGASSGNLMVMSEKGASNTVFFELDASAGTRVFKDKRTYTVKTSLDIRDVVGGSGSGLYLWLPRVQESPSQREVQLLNQEPKAEIENYNGLMLVFLKNLSRNKTYRVSQTYILDRYSIETKVNLSKLKTVYDTDRTLYRVYTAANAFTPVEEPAVVKAANSAVGREKNPYQKALKLYSYVISRLKFDNEKSNYDALKGLNDRVGDSYTYATLYVAMLRASGIPARTISGYIVTDEKTAVTHFWSEFYLENCGWVPVDPALGDKASIKGFPLPADPENYYFANNDNRHIAFSRGLVQAKRVTPHGRSIEQPEIHSLQTIYAEAVGDLTSYSGTWNNLQVVGIY